MLNNSGLMTIEDLAGYLKVTRRTIYDWLKQNKIPHKRCWYFFIVIIW